MILTGILCGITVGMMVFSVFRIPVVRFGRFQLGGYCFFALLGAVLLLALGCVSPAAALRGIFAKTSVNPVKILVLFLSMTSFSIYLDELGFFRYLAAAVLRRAGSSQRVLFFYLYAVVSVLTVFTSNDIIILTFTPFIVAFAKNAAIDPLPYLFAEFFAANTWSMVLMIGNPTNIYLASSFGIGFFDYLLTMLLPTVAAGGVSLCMLLLLFHGSLKKQIEAEPVTASIEERTLTLVGLVHLLLCIVMLVVSGYIGIEMWLVSLVLMLSLFLWVLVYRKRRRESPRVLYRTLRRMPWELIPFMLSMFILVLSLEEAGIVERIAVLLGARGSVWIYGICSYFVANLINNIPMSVLFSGLAELYRESGAVYGAIVGSNLGACLTPVGALAGIMWSDILRRLGVRFDFRDFVKYGAAVSIPSLLACLGILQLVLL